MSSLIWTNGARPVAPPATELSRNVAVDLFEHGAVVLRLLSDLRPQRVACVAAGTPFEQRLGEYASALGFEVIAEPARADLVISGAGDYASVRKLLDEIRDANVPLVVGGTAWPCGRRDARRDLEPLEREERSRYAFGIPVPGQSALSDHRSPIAFATVEGGPRNGVRTAVEDACRDAPDVWDVRLLQGFGGVAVMLPRPLAVDSRWDTILAASASDAMLSRVELANVQLRLDRERLLGELDRALERAGDLSSRALGMQRDLAAVGERLGLALAELNRVARELTSREAADLEQRSRLEERLLAVLADADDRLSREHERAQARERALASEQAARAELAGALADEQAESQRSRDSATEQLEQLRLELERQSQAREDEQAFVRVQAQRIAESGAWRWGHRFAKLKSRLLFRRSRGTDAVSRLLERSATASQRPLDSGDDSPTSA